MEDGGNWLGAFLLTALAVSVGVILAGYIGGMIASKSAPAG